MSSISHEEVGHRGSLPTPFAELAAMVQQLRERGLDAGVDASIIKNLLDASKRIEAVHATAAEMMRATSGWSLSALRRVTQVKKPSRAKRRAIAPPV